MGALLYEIYDGNLTFLKVYKEGCFKRKSTYLAWDDLILWKERRTLNSQTSALSLSNLLSLYFKSNSNLG